MGIAKQKDDVVCNREASASQNYMICGVNENDKPFWADAIEKPLWRTVLNSRRPHHE